MNANMKNDYLVPVDSILKVFIALWVVVVRPDEHTSLPSGNSKWSNTSHHITHNLARLKHPDNSCVLFLKFAIPIYLGVVELENTTILVDLDVQIVWTCEDLVAKCPELRAGAYIVRFVDDRTDMLVLLNQNLPNQ